jgi:hypothetical protein
MDGRDGREVEHLDDDSDAAADRGLSFTDAVDEQFEDDLDWFGLATDRAVQHGQVASNHP